MINYLVIGRFSTYDMIKQTDRTFRFKNKSYGRVVDVHDNIATYERWNDIHSRIEVCEINGHTSFSKRLKGSIEKWHA